MTKKALPLLLLLLSSVFAVGQTTVTVTNGPSGSGCLNPNYPSTYYCVAMHRYSSTGTFEGYLAFWLKLAPGGATFTNGEVFVLDATGNSIFTATNFAGTFNGTDFQGTYSTTLNGKVVTGSIYQVMAPRLACAGRYGCHWTVGDSGGKGSYQIH